MYSLERIEEESAPETSKLNDTVQIRVLPDRNGQFGVIEKDAIAQWPSDKKVEIIPGAITILRVAPEDLKRDSKTTGEIMSKFAQVESLVFGTGFNAKFTQEQATEILTELYLKDVPPTSSSVVNILVLGQRIVGGCCLVGDPNPQNVVDALIKSIRTYMALNRDLSPSGIEEYFRIKGIYERKLREVSEQALKVAEDGTSLIDFGEVFIDKTLARDFIGRNIQNLRLGFERNRNRIKDLEGVSEDVRRQLSDESITDLDESGVYSLLRNILFLDSISYVEGKVRRSEESTSKNRFSVVFWTQPEIPKDTMYQMFEQLLTISKLSTLSGFNINTYFKRIGLRAKVRDLLPFPDVFERIFDEFHNGLVTVSRVPLVDRKDIAWLDETTSKVPEILVGAIPTEPLKKVLDTRVYNAMRFLTPAAWKKAMRHFREQ